MRSLEDLTYKAAFFIGCFQVLVAIPGTIDFTISITFIINLPYMFCLLYFTSGRISTYNTVID